MNIQQNPNCMKFGGQKLLRTLKIQMVRRLRQEAKVPGICVVTKAAAAPSWHLLQDTGRRVRSPAPSPTRAGRAVWHQEEPGCWKPLGQIETKWETHRGRTHPLGLWIPTPEKLGCQATPGERRRVGPCWTLTQIVSSLVGKLDYMKSQALVKNHGLKQQDFTQKRALSRCLRNS